MCVIHWMNSSVTVSCWWGSCRDTLGSRTSWARWQLSGRRCWDDRRSHWASKGGALGTDGHLDGQATGNPRCPFSSLAPVTGNNCPPHCGQHANCPAERLLHIILVLSRCVRLSPLGRFSSACESNGAFEWIWTRVRSWSRFLIIQTCRLWCLSDKIHLDRVVYVVLSSCC